MELQKELDAVAAQEQTLRFSSFSAEDAWSLGCLMVEKAKKESHSLAISIDMNGQKLFYYAFGGTHLNNESAVARKSRVAHVFRCCSLRVYYELKISGTSIEDRGRAPADYLAVGGAVPIHIKNTGVVGTVCVSGLAPVDDHRFVVSCMQQYLAQNR